MQTWHCPPVATFSVVAITPMECGQAYETATQRHVADAEHKIVFDRFHVMKHTVAEVVQYAAKSITVQF